MARYRQYDLYRATNHRTGVVEEYIAYPTWAFDYGFDLVDDPYGCDTDIELLEKGGFIYVHGETISGYPIGGFITTDKLSELSKNMRNIYVEEVEYNGTHESAEG